MAASTRDSAQRAFEQGDFDAARQGFEAALAEERTAEALDGLGQSLWFLCEIDAGIARREEAYVEYRRSGNVPKAAEIALWLSLEQATSIGNSAAANGWFKRAERLLADAPLCPAHAELEVARGVQAPDPAAAQRHFERAVEIGKELGDPDSEIRGLNQLGLMKVAGGDVDGGTALLDETMAAAMAGEVDDPWAIGATCCAVLFACEQMADVRRAAEWSRAVIEFTERRKYMPLSALCRSIHAAVLIATGDWQRAEAQLLAAIRAYRGHDRPLAAYPLARLADLRLRQGRIEEAEQLIAGWESHPETQLPAIALLVARGEYDLGAARIEQALSGPGAAGPAAVPLLALLLETCLARGDLEGGREAASRMSELAEQLGHRHLIAAANQAGARVAAAARDLGQARSALASAVRQLDGLGMPFELARARLDLARLTADEQPNVAIAEAQAALDSLDRLGAGTGADEAAELLRSLGVKGRRAPRRAGELTKREAEVLELLGQGLSNKEIAARLFISPKTASHHVGHILSKLDLRNRAEAAAYATRQAPPEPAAK